MKNTTAIEDNSFSQVPTQYTTVTARILNALIETF